MFTHPLLLCVCVASANCSCNQSDCSESFISTSPTFLFRFPSLCSFLLSSPSLSFRLVSHRENLLIFHSLFKSSMFKKQLSCAQGSRNGNKKHSRTLISLLFYLEKRRNLYFRYILKFGYYLLWENLKGLPTFYARFDRKGNLIPVS